MPPNSYPIRKDIYGTYRAAKKYTAPKIPTSLEASDQEHIYAEPLDHGKITTSSSAQEGTNMQQQQSNENIYQVSYIEIRAYFWTVFGPGFATSVLSISVHSQQTSQRFHLTIWTKIYPKVNV